MLWRWSSFISSCDNKYTKKNPLKNRFVLAYRSRVMEPPQRGRNGSSWKGIEQEGRRELRTYCIYRQILDGRQRSATGTIKSQNPRPVTSARLHLPKIPQLPKQSHQPGTTCSNTGTWRGFIVNHKRHHGLT